MKIIDDKVYVEREFYNLVDEIKAIVQEKEALYIKKIEDLEKEIATYKEAYNKLIEGK